MDAMPTGYSQQPQTSWLRDRVPAPQLPSGHAMPEGNFAVASEGGQPGELLALDSLFDLSLYDNMGPLAPPAAAPPTAMHADAYPLQLQSHPTPAYTFDEPASQPGPSTFPQDNGFGQPPQPLVDPAGTMCVPAPAQQLPPWQPWPPPPPASQAPPPYFWDALATLVDPAPAAPSPAPNPVPPDIHTLLDEPLTATLIASQLSNPRRRNNRRPEQPEHSTQPAAVIGPSAPSITKPKRKKLRPNDTIRTLQQHLEGIAGKLQQLTLHNKQLQRKKQVLAVFVQELAHIEGVVIEIQTGVAQHEANPSQPPHGVAAFQYWTPQQFGEAYLTTVKLAGGWVTKAEASSTGPGDTLSAADMAQLADVVQDFLWAVVCALYGRIEFVGQVMAQQLQLYSRTMPEEEHWSNVVASMELTDEQVEDLLVAREVYRQYLDKVDREREAEVQHRIRQASSGGADLVPEQDQIIKMAAFIKKIHNLNLILTMYWFKHILTPLQAARTLVHAYPLVPGGRLLSNTLYARRGQAPREPLLGPPPGPTATIRTAAGALQSLAGGTRPCGLPPASQPPIPAPALQPLITTGANRSGQATGAAANRV